MAIRFEGYERRIDKINACLKEYDLESLEAARDLCLSKGVDADAIVRGTQPIAFENAVWAYTLGCAIALRKGCTAAADAAEAIGIGLQAFCIPGSVADQRKVGLGHGNLGAMLLREDTQCFAFLAGHESFAAAEGAIGIAKTANKVRKTPLKVILNGLGKDAAYIISRINGFTYVKTQYDYYTGELNEVSRTAFSDGERSQVLCYGADDVNEGVAIMRKEKVDVSITGNSTNPTRFQHPVAGTYKKWAVENGKKILLCGKRRRYGQNSSSRQYGGRPRFLRHDRHDGQNALGCAVCRLLLCARSRGDDGSDRDGQQPHGRSHCCVRGCRGRGHEEVKLRKRHN